MNEFAVSEADQFGNRYAYLPCACGGMDHNILLCESATNAHKMEFKNYEFLITLNPALRWYERIWLAFKYVFRLDSRSTVYHSVAMTEENFKKISTIFDKKEQATNGETDQGGSQGP